MASCRGFTLCLLKFFNFILAVLGVLIVIYAAFMIKQTASSSGGSSSPPSGSSPPSSPSSHSPPSHHKSPPSHSPPSPHGDLIQGGNVYYTADLPFIKMPLKGATSWNLASEEQLSKKSSGTAVSSVSWFIWAFLGAGILVIIVTLIGALAAEARSDCLMCTYLIGLFVILIVEIAVGLFLFFDKSWRQDLPDDPSGTEHKVERFIKQNIEIFLWGGLGVLAVEILALVFAWLLFCVRTRPREDHDEHGHNEEGAHEDEYVLAKTGDRHVLIPRSVTQQAPKVTATGPYMMPTDNLPTVQEQAGHSGGQGHPELEDRNEKKGVKKFFDNMFSKDK